MKKQTLISLLCETFRRMGEKPAILFLRNGREETCLSFRQLDQDSDLMAHAFLGMGVGKGDCVILFLPKSVAWVIGYIALQKIGAIAVPLNPAFRKAEMAYFLQETMPKLVVSGKEQERTLLEIAPEVHVLAMDTDNPYKGPPGPGEVAIRDLAEQGNPRDPGIILFTSGTTGRPKGAILTQENLCHDVRNIIRLWEIVPEDTLCHALPLFHAHGLCFALHASLLAGATTIMLETFDPDSVIDVLSQKSCTVFMAVPTMYSRMLERLSGRPIDLSHMRLLTSGSAPLLVKDFERIKKTFGKEPLEREGMSETLLNFSNPLHGTRKPGSIGLPAPHLEVRVVDPLTLKDVPGGQVGEIWLKGPGITPGYWRRPEETERAFEKGWFRTGDLGRQDEEGYYYLTDRIKNIIISGGENISPQEVEMVINGEEDVLESCVVGLPDETWGEIVVTAVVARDQSHLTPEDVKAHCRENLLSWKCPKKILIVDRLPRNPMGKVLREEVRELF